MLDTKRLIMRPFTPQDFDLLFSLYGSETIMQYMPWDTETAEKAQSHLDLIVSEWKSASPKRLEFAVTEKESGAKIGRAHINVEEDNGAIIGWLLLEPYWGKGYATELTHALLFYGFHTLHLHRIYALCHPDNIGSWKALARAGMRREAYFKQKCKYTKKGEILWEDELEYAILASEYLV